MGVDKDPAETYTVYFALYLHSFSPFDGCYDSCSCSTKRLSNPGQVKTWDAQRGLARAARPLALPAGASEGQ